MGVHESLIPIVGRDGYSLIYNIHTSFQWDGVRSTMSSTVINIYRCIRSTNRESSSSLSGLCDGMTTSSAKGLPVQVPLHYATSPRTIYTIDEPLPPLGIDSAKGACLLPFQGCCCTARLPFRRRGLITPEGANKGSTIVIC